MITLDVTSNLRDIDRVLTNLQKKEIPFATTLAMTRTSKMAQEDHKKEVKRVFRSPVRWTINSTFIKPAKKKDWPNISTEVFLKDWDEQGGTPAAKYLQAQINGGDRRHTKVEGKLRSKGHLKRGEKIVPSIMMKKNSKGNVSRANYNKILSDMGAHFDSATNQTDPAKKKYFIAELAGIKGIWRRKSVRGKKNEINRLIRTRTLVGPKRLPGKGKVAPNRGDKRVELMFIIVDRPFRYKKRYDFIGVTMKTFREDFNNNYIIALNHAIATQNVKKARRR